MKHWLGFLVIASILAIAVCGMTGIYNAMNVFTLVFLVSFAAFVVRGALRRFGGSAGRRRA